MPPFRYQAHPRARKLHLATSTLTFRLPRKFARPRIATDRVSTFTRVRNNDACYIASKIARAARQFLRRAAISRTTQRNIMARWRGYHKSFGADARLDRTLWEVEESRAASDGFIRCGFIDMSGLW